MQKYKSSELFILVITLEDATSKVRHIILSQSYKKKEYAIEAAEGAAQHGKYANVYKVTNGECVEEFKSNSENLKVLKPRKGIKTLKEKKDVNLYILVISEKTQDKKEIEEIETTSWTKKEEAVKAAKKEVKKGNFAKIYNIQNNECLDEFKPE